MLNTEKLTLGSHSRTNKKVSVKHLPLEKATGERDMLDSALVSVAAETRQVSGTVQNKCSKLILREIVATVSTSWAEW